MKLKKKHKKLISNLWVKLKELDIDLFGLFGVNDTFTSISEEDIEDFKKLMSKSEKEKFEEYEIDTQRAVVGQNKADKKKNEMMLNIIDIIIVENEQFEEEIDAILSAATEKTQDELDDMDLDDYIILIKEVFTANASFFTTSAAPKKGI